MTRMDSSSRPDQESVEHGLPTAGRGSTPELPGSLRGALTSGVAAGLGGGLVLFSGLRALRRGQWGRGIVRLSVGGLLLALGVRQRRAGGVGSQSGVDQEDVVDTSPDVGHVDDAGLDEDDHASGEAARDVVESSVDVEDVADESASGGQEAGATGGQSGDESAEGEIDFASDVAEPREGVGAGAFDARRGVPVPETAFEDGFLDLESDVFWAIRESDDAVFVSRHQSVFEDSEGVEYVTSSQVDDEQILSVPDVILDHWEGVDDAEPVADADELVFATTDDLRWVDVLWIVSEHRTDEFDEL